MPEIKSITLRQSQRVRIDHPNGIQSVKRKTGDVRVYTPISRPDGGKAGLLDERTDPRLKSLGWNSMFGCIDDSPSRQLSASRSCSDTLKNVMP